MKASATSQWITQHLEKALSSVAKPNQPFARKINHFSISHLRTPFIIFLAILNSITFIFPQTCVSVTFLGCKYMKSDTSNSLFYFEFGDCFLCQVLPPPPLECYLLCKIKRNIACRLHSSLVFRFRNTKRRFVS